jgi:hypothetical protein
MNSFIARLKNLNLPQFLLVVYLAATTVIGSVFAIGTFKE